MGFIKGHRIAQGLVLILLPMILGGCYTQLKVVEEKPEARESYEEDFYDGFHSGIEYRNHDIYNFWHPDWFDLSIGFGWHSSRYWQSFYFGSRYAYYPYWHSYWWDRYYYNRYYASWFYRDYYWRRPFYVGHVTDLGEDDIRLSGVQRIRYGVTDLNRAGIDRLGRIDRHRSSSSIFNVNNKGERIRSWNSSSNNHGIGTRIERKRSSGNQIRSSGKSSGRSSSGSSSSGSSKRKRSGSDDH